jgi:hypothetical protein
MSFSLRNVRNACITKRDGGWELLTLPILSEKRKERGTRNSKLKPERRLKRGHPPGVKTMNKPKRTQIYFARFLARAEDSSGGGCGPKGRNTDHSVSRKHWAGGAPFAGTRRRCWDFQGAASFVLWRVRKFDLASFRLTGP